MKTERKPILKPGDELILPAVLFLFVLKELKEKNSFDSIRVGKYEEVIRNIFGNEYVKNNWEYIKPDLLGHSWIEIFSGLIEKDELYKFIKITDEGIWLIMNGVPGEWCKNSIEMVVKNLRIRD